MECKNFSKLCNLLRDLSALSFRLILAYTFYGTGIEKWSNIEGTAKFFGEDLGMPFPLVNAYLASGTELAGCALLTLGLLTRLISLPLMIVMVVAIVTVHWANGFSCGQNGFEIPFYFLLMLFSLFTSGAGRISLDYLLGKRFGCCRE